MNQKQSSIFTQKEKKTEKYQNQEILIKKKIKIEKKVVIKVPFADIVQSDDDLNDDSQILNGIRTKFINDVPNLDSPVPMKNIETKEDSQLF